MKTLKIAVIAAATLLPLGIANAGTSELRTRLATAQQTLAQEMQVIEQESNLYRASSPRQAPAVQSQEQSPVDYAALSLPGKVESRVLLKTNGQPGSTEKPAVSCVIDVQFDLPGPAAE